jgi:Xaa-Pro dipeptidase
MSQASTTPNYADRHHKLASALTEHNLNAIVLNPGPSLPYFTGLGFHLSERPVVVFFGIKQAPILVLPELEALKLENLSYEIQAFTYGEEPKTWVKAFKAAIKAGGFEQGKIGVEPRALRVLELDLLQEAAPQAEFISGEKSVAALRMRKDENEIDAMRSAAKIALSALRSTFPYICSGRTEKEIAAELVMHLLRHGSNPQLPFSPIVSGGPNSANPHASPTDRRLKAGDLLVIDWGANVDGYFSDITRTFAVGKVDEELCRIAEIVNEANSVGRETSGPGVKAAEIDIAARNVIEQAGYGEYFTHRTGHGLGLEGHEEPYIRGNNQLTLEVGMTFTIEPGIYLPGRGGVRIEDDVVVTEEGIEILTDIQRELITLEA